MYWSPGVRGNWLADAPRLYGPPAPLDWYSSPAPAAAAERVSRLPQKPQNAAPGLVADRHSGQVTRATPRSRPATTISTPPLLKARIRYYR